MWKAKNPSLLHEHQTLMFIIQRSNYGFSENRVGRREHEYANKMPAGQCNPLSRSHGPSTVKPAARSAAIDDPRRGKDLTIMTAKQNAGQLVPVQWPRPTHSKPGRASIIMLVNESAS